jgi:hypothetical protein
LFFGLHKDAVARGKIKYVLDAPGLDRAVPRDSSEERHAPEAARPRVAGDNVGVA